MNTSRPSWVRPWRKHVALAAMSVIEQEVRNAAYARSAMS